MTGVNHLTKFRVKTPCINPHQSNSSPCICADRVNKSTLYILYRCQYCKAKYICTVLYKKQAIKSQIDLPIASLSETPGGIYPSND